MVGKYHGSIPDTPYPRGVSRREPDINNPRYPFGRRSKHTKPGVQLRFPNWHPFRGAVVTNHDPEYGTDMNAILVESWGTQSYINLVRARNNTSEINRLTNKTPEITSTLNGQWLAMETGQRPVPGKPGGVGRTPNPYARVAPGGGKIF
jgi:hypothetical protein